MITGLDLVEWQFRVAAGEALPLRQDQVAMRGHAIEARIYAEDPERGFLPSIGRIAHLRTPRPGADVRVDTGVRCGDEISQYYDPLVAKLIAWGEDRPAALRRLRGALDEYQVVGVTTNVDFLRRLTAHAAFAEARLDTGLIASNHAALFPARVAPSDRMLASAALGEWLALRDAAAAAAIASNDPHSPWQEVDGWWLNSTGRSLELDYAAGDASYPVRIRTHGPDLAHTVEIAGRRHCAVVQQRDTALAVTLDGVEGLASVVRLGEERYLFSAEGMVRLRLVDPLAHAGEDFVPGRGHLTAPMSGSIVAVLVAAGDAVERGAPLLILEAMKMEHTIAAPAAGTVTAVHYREGDQVREGVDLIDIAVAPPPA
jgi:3-methylcrotonyl-CoA carboxylase alpha subunit